MIDQTEEDVQIENNVFLRVAVADLMRRRGCNLHDFNHQYFKQKVDSLTVIGMIGIVLNWSSKRMSSQFNQYLAECVGDDAISFKRKKKIIVQTLKSEQGLWPTDQVCEISDQCIGLERSRRSECQCLRVLCGENDNVDDIE